VDRPGFSGRECWLHHAGRGSPIYSSLADDQSLGLLDLARFGYTAEYTEAVLHRSPHCFGYSDLDAEAQSNPNPDGNGNPNACTAQGGGQLSP